MGVRDSTPDLLRIFPDVATRLQVGRSQAYELVKSGALPSVRISSKTVRIRPEALEAFILEREAHVELVPSGDAQ